MKEGLVVFFGLVMVAYLLFLGVAAAFLPLAGGFFYGHIGAYYVSLILIAVAAIALSFFEKRGLAGLLGVVELLIVISFWCVGFRGFWDWSNFCWNVLPALVFAACAVANWILCRTAPAQPEADGGANIE